jgi:site-specific recombinase XerD
MVQKYFKRAFARCRMAAGHLSIILDDFVSDLHDRGHTANTIQQYTQAVEHFGAWLGRRGVALESISADHVRSFLSQHLRHCRCPMPAAKSLRTCRAAIGRLMDCLHRHGVVRLPGCAKPARSGVDRLLLAYDHHLDRVCGLSTSSRRARQRYARQFLAWRFGAGRPCLWALRPKDVVTFVSDWARTRTHGGVHDLVVGLRSFLRFLGFSRRIAKPLWRAVPGLAAVPSHQPPTVLLPDELNRFLKCFDRTSPRGRRDYAIALCLAKLGLRAAEVAGLSFDDVDWRAMVIRLRKTKQQRERRLPLPPQVARAVARYLRAGRPPSPTRALFVRQRAPLGEALKPHHVRSVVRLGFARCGIAYTGTHVLRHTWATHAHRRGLSLKVLGDILGHRCLNTTARYAHVNLDELRQAALPWPGGEVEP